MMEGQTATIDEHLHETKITNKKKESYKTTELGFIPESWKIVKFEEVLSLFNGYAFKSTDAVESSNTQLIRMGNLYQNKLALERKPIFYPDSYAQKYSKYVLQEGDLIISLTGTSEKEDYGFTVKINKTNKNLLLNQRVARIDIISADVNRDYIFYFLLSRIFLTPLFLTAKGMKQANLSTNAIKKLNVVIPPIEEQRKIAGVLWLVQNAIAQQEQLITLTTELKKALIQKLFTEGTRNEPQKMTEIGLIPESWDVIPLGNMFQIKHGYAFDGEYFKPEGEFILMTPGHFYEDGGFRDQKDKTKYYTGKVPDGYLLNEGDLLVAMTEQKSGLLGSSAFIPESNKYLHNQRLGLIERLDESYLYKQFLFHIFNTPHIRSEISRTATGSKVKHTSPSKIRDIIFGLPDIQEQIEIAFLLDKVAAKIDALVSIKKVMSELFRTLLHQLMTAQIRVDDLNFSAFNLEPQGGDE
ncbi:restriction endonuclease subunit S [Microcoleus sp. F10-C6]|uniref:restriction endonuclease subunit S n=1 Tax=unclassified Microcoleus TaxID=2642155 RepID=UPI002FD47CA2